VQSCNPWLFSVALINMLAIPNVPREFHHGRDWRAFLSSCTE
jgi:cytochrome bd ubiquinol oxidase subunit II